MRRQMNELPRSPRPSDSLCVSVQLSSLLLRSIEFQAEDLLPPIAFPEGEAANEETDETANANRLFAKRREKASSGDRET